MDATNMKKLIIYIFISIVPINIYSYNTDSLLNILDKEIAIRKVYMNIKETKIDSLRKLTDKNLSPEKKYEMNKLIFEEYYTYKYDSAMHYLRKNEKLANILENRKYKDEVLINRSKLLSTAGLINESLNNINSLNRAELDSSLLLVYYETMESIYYTAKNYSNDSIYTPLYTKIEQTYIDSIYNVLPGEYILKTYYKGFRLFNKGQLNEAEQILSDLCKNLSMNTRLYAIVCSNLATINKLQQKQQDHEKYLILAAISDQICALKENAAMQRLAILLSENRPEELTRAYNYINYSMEDAHFYNNRLRIVQIAQNMPIIIKAYQLKSEKENKSLRSSLITTSILLFIVIILIIYLYRQIKTIKKNRKELYILNLRLNKLNDKLQSANRIREESISLFVDLSSSYLNRMDQFRETVKRKILAKQIDDLHKISDNSDTVHSMLGSFLQIFDNAFLKLYPTFVDEFNKLLAEDGKIKLKTGELLNSELRVFALIKLGIKDSSKIASFLHYSPQTVYNYRNKVKNFSVVDRNDFEKYVQEIGEII